mmetsp:Transcript_7287/g.21468  ORF Transcript_7287/g.21468 Transcript_7287/m.21468 type:complete len:273 (+) Transcript_7287:1394-2212(+)
MRRGKLCTRSTADKSKASTGTMSSSTTRASPRASRTPLSVSASAQAPSTPSMWRSASSGNTASAKRARPMCSMATSATAMSGCALATLAAEARRAAKAAALSRPLCCRVGAPAATKRARRSMREAMRAASRTPGCSCGTAPSSASRVPRWNSSENPWMRACMRYCCAMSSRQPTTCSSTRGSTSPRYVSKSRPSSWLRYVRFLPTRSASCCRSASRAFRSAALRADPWCCMRTQSLFISAKFCSRNSMASVVVPPVGVSYPLPTSGSRPRTV